jgi:class 3 adenylate cyclase/tetratricopeptide (TPR) repeat protein
MPLEFNSCGNCGIEFSGDSELINRDFQVTQKQVQDSSNEKTPTVASDELPQAASHPLPLIGERRLATVVIADVKGSTYLSEKIGTEAWVEVMNKVLQICTAEILRFGGEVDQFRGDGLVAFFGARSAHEDDPERAVLAAMTMQRAIHKVASDLLEIYGIDFQLRVGVNTGEVIAANIGNKKQHSENTAMGSAIALAARMESSADPGTVLVSENTYRLVETKFKWESLGEIAVNGISEPVVVFRPLAPLSQNEQNPRLQEFSLATPLIGRDQEYNAIQRTIIQLRDGVGGIVMVDGGAGLGKSHLINEVIRSNKRDEALVSDGGQYITWLKGQCRSYDHSLTHSMWIDIIHDWLGLHEWEIQGRVLSRLRQKCIDLWGDEYNQYYPTLAKFLSLPIEKTFLGWIEQLEGESLRKQFFLVIKNWIKTLAKRGPVVFTFTEAHWADDASLELLKYCLSLSNHEPILWLVVFRPDPTAPTWNLNRYVQTEYPHRVTTVHLSNLSHSESRVLIENLIGTNVLPEGMQNNILERAEGNPYFLTEIVRSLVDRGILVRGFENGEWQVTDAEASLDIPDTLIGLLTARITRLTSIEQHVLQMASVIGTVFWSNLLGALTRDDFHIDATLSALQRNRLIRERGFVSELGTEYVFISALIRDAAYASLLTSKRKQHHISVAEYLEALISQQTIEHYHGLIAYNYRQANIFKKELFHTLLAAENAQLIYANTEAIIHFSRALDLIDELSGESDPPTINTTNKWRLEVLTGLGRIHFGIGEVTKAEVYLQQAVNLGRKIEIGAQSLARLFYWLGEVLFWQGNYEKPIHLGEEGLFLLGENTQNIETALMNQLVAVGCSQLGDHEKFITFTQQTASFIKTLPYSEELRPAYDHIIGLYAYTLKDVKEAENWLSLFKQKAEENHDLRAQGEVYNHTASLMNRQGNLKAATGYYTKALEYFTRIGDDKHSCRTLRGLGVCFMQLGYLDRAKENIFQSLEKAQLLENKIDSALGYWFKAQIFLCQGYLDEATISFKIAQELVQNIPAIRGGWAFLGLGQIHFSQANAQEITGTYKATLENDPDLVFRNPYQTANILSKLERTFEIQDNFQAYVDLFRDEHPELKHAPFSQWYLIPGETSQSATNLIFRDDFLTGISDNWEKIDPYDDCKFTFNGGLTIQAANERNLHHINRSAPRLVYCDAITEDFSIQTKCFPLTIEKPAIGGLLLWQSEVKWVCLEIGAHGPGEIIFRGFKDNQDMVFGRGILKTDGIYLQFEKQGNQITAFCSPNGKNWLFVGSMHLASNEAVTPGLHGNGHINRMIYPGAYPEGTAICFKNFQLWEI